MRKFVSTLILTSLLVLSPLTMQARDWTAVVRDVAAATVRLSHHVSYLNMFGQHVEGEAVCSGFVINKKQAYVMTAYHCLNEEGGVEGLKITGLDVPLWLVYANEDIDLAIISAPVNVGVRALKPSKVALQAGQEIGAYGYGYGLAHPLFRAGHVSNTGMDLEIPEFPGLWAMMDQTFIGGMSGGPVFNVDGKVVGVVQIGNEDMGMWRPFSEIWKVSKAYWG